MQGIFFKCIVQLIRMEYCLILSDWIIKEGVQVATVTIATSFVIAYHLQTVSY